MAPTVPRASPCLAAACWCLRATTLHGRTTITSGTVALAHRLGLQDSTVNVSMSGTLGFSAGITSPILGGLADAGDVVLATAASEPVTLNVGGNTQSTFYCGKLSGPGNLVKQGIGTLTLGTSSSYGGATIISGGILRLSSIPTSPLTTNLIYQLDPSDPRAAL